LASNLNCREPGIQVFRELDQHPADEQFRGVVVLRLDEELFFATSDALKDRVREVTLSTPGITGMVLDYEGIDFIDSQVRPGWVRSSSTAFPFDQRSADLVKVRSSSSRRPAC
jgi:MFS superfamily sulfate permease-like transporter